MTPLMARVGAVHAHSNYSHDGRDSLADLHRVMTAHGIGFLGLTDHAEDVSPEQWAELVDECARLSRTGTWLIPGLEFRFAGHPGVHLLATGLRRWMRPETPAEFFAQVAGHAALTVAAHPGLARYVLPPEVEAGIDAIEVWNGAFNTRYLPDPRAIALLRRVRRRRPEVVGTVGLDQHDRRNVLELRVLLPSAVPDPLAELRAGRFRNHGRTMAFSSTLDWPGAMLGALYGARAVFDRIESVHDWFARRRRARAHAL
jgi:hypothetical protein